MARHSPVRYSDEINDKLIKWMNETGYTIVQINGQRISSSPRVDRKPSRGCEVFVGKIPHECYEDELFPVFRRAGHIHELRLMMTFSGRNRGYAFVMYERLEDAQRAVAQLNNYEIRCGQRIGVLPCENNCRLFIGCFEAGERAETHVQVLREETEHVISVNRRIGRDGRWHLLVEYANHRAAAIARRELAPRKNQLFGPRVTVDWETPGDRRGRRVALDQRRVPKASNMLRLYKLNEDLQASDALTKNKISVYQDKGTFIKPNRQMLPSSSPTSMIQSDFYENMWLRNSVLNQTSCFWPNDVLYSNTISQPLGNGSEKFVDFNTTRRPVTRQSNLELGSQLNFQQDSNNYSVDVNNNVPACVYHPLAPRAHQGLARSTDSSLYSDPDCHRPLSSDSSGSACSSFSQSNWEGSTRSSGSTGSSHNMCPINWDRTLSNGRIDSTYMDAGNQQLTKRGNVTADGLSLSPPWNVEEQPGSFFSADLNCNRGSIWNTRFQSQEDHELIDNLFTKEERPLKPPNSEYQEFNVSLRALSLSTSNGLSNNYFGRAVQVPQSCVTSLRGSLNPSSRRVY